MTPEGVSFGGVRGSLLVAPYTKYQGGWPLVIRVGQSVRWLSMPLSDQRSAAMAGMLSTESLISVAPHESFLLYAGVPVSALQIAGGGTRGLAPFTATPVVGDPRIGGRLRVFGYAHQTVSVHLGGEVQLDSNWWNRVPNNFNDQTLRGTLELLVGGCLGDCPPRKLTGHAAQWGVNFGVHFRPRAVPQPSGAPVGAHEFRTGWAVGYRYRGFVRGNGVLEFRAGVEAATARALFVRGAATFVELAFPVAVVLSQDVDLSLVPSTTSPNADWNGSRAWGYGLTARLSYALHDRVLDRAVERRMNHPLPGGAEPTHEDQDTDRDGRADITDPCPNDPQNLCVTSEPVPRAYEPSASSMTAVRRERNVLLVDGVTTLIEPLVASQRVDPTRADGLRSDPGFVFDDRVVARALRAELARLPSSGESFVALWLRVDHGGDDVASMLRAWAFASVVRALRREGLDPSIVLDPAPGYSLERAVTAAQDRFALVLVARRDSSRDRRLASDWMPPFLSTSAGASDAPRGASAQHEHGESTEQQSLPPSLRAHFDDYRSAQ